jgi:hypothetical protein
MNVHPENQLVTDESLEALALKIAERQQAFTDLKAEVIAMNETGGEENHPTFFSKRLEASDKGTMLAADIIELEEKAAELNPSFFPKREEGTQAIYLTARRTFRGLLDEYIAGIAAGANFSIPADNRYFDSIVRKI